MSRTNNNEAGKQMKTAIGAANVAVGTKVTIVNKYGDEIAEGKITEVERAGFAMDSGDSVPFSVIESMTASVIKLTVSGAQL